MTGGWPQWKVKNGFAFVVLMCGLVLALPSHAQKQQKTLPFRAKFLFSNAHSIPLLLEVGLSKGSQVDAYILDSRLSADTKIPVAPWIASLLFKEVQEQEKVFLKWKKRPKAGRAKDCRDKLELSLVVGEKTGAWSYCVDAEVKDPQAQVARRWLNFVDQSLRDQVHPVVDRARKKATPVR